MGVFSSVCVCVGGGGGRCVGVYPSGCVGVCLCIGVRHTVPEACRTTKLVARVEWYNSKKGGRDKKEGPRIATALTFSMHVCERHDAAQHDLSGLCSVITNAVGVGIL